MSWIYDGKVYIERISEGGDFLDDEPTVVDVGGNDEIHLSDVASNGTDFMVTWTNGAFFSLETHALLVRAADGEVVNPNEHLVFWRWGYWGTGATSTVRMDIAAVDDDFVIVGGDCAVLDVARIHVADGSITTLTETLEANVGRSVVSTHFEADVASDGSTYLVVWEDDRSSPMLGRDIYARLFDGDGAPLSPEPFVITEAPGDQRHPAVSSNGTHYFVTWADSRNGEASGIDIYGARISTADGLVLDPDGIVVSDAVSHQVQPSTAASKDTFFVVWEDFRDYDTRNRDVYGARITTDEGLNLDEQGIRIETPAGDEPPEVQLEEGLPQTVFDGQYFYIATSAGDALLDPSTGGVYPGAGDATVLASAAGVTHITSVHPNLWFHWFEAAPPGVIPPLEGPLRFDFECSSHNIDLAAIQDNYVAVCIDNGKEAGAYPFTNSGEIHLVVDQPVRLSDPEEDSQTSSFKTISIAASSRNFMTAFTEATDEGILRTRVQILEPAWCTIDGTQYFSGSVNPDNPNLICHSDRSTDEWSPVEVDTESPDTDPDIATNGDAGAPNDTGTVPGESTAPRPAEMTRPSDVSTPKHGCQCRAVSGAQENVLAWPDVLLMLINGEYK